MYLQKIIQSPLNYTGGKCKLLSQILPLFPQKINTFIDLFCGGCNVGMNIQANKIIYNDTNKYLLPIYNTFKMLDKEHIFSLIYHIIDKYKLSLVSKNGYEYYGCESINGLSSYNKDKFLELRSDFNNITYYDSNYYIMLYVLIVYAFNNQIRFNKNGEYNLPVGKRDFNKKIADKLSIFIDILKKQNNIFICNDFSEFNVLSLSHDDFVYLDPPYLITCATYNEQGGWDENKEKKLLDFIDKLNNNNIKFALSNVLRSKGKENINLINWIEKNKYKVLKLNSSYSNSNYQTKDKITLSEEVLVINY